MRRRSTATDWSAAMNEEAEGYAGEPPKPRKTRPRKPQPPSESESQAQAAVVQWWGIYCRTVGLDYRLLHAIPNGAYLGSDPKRRAIQMGKLKAEGLRAGYPDMALDLPITDVVYVLTGGAPMQRGCLIFAGLRLELKVGKNKPSSEQSGYHDLLRVHGLNVVTVWGSAEAIRAIQTYVEQAIK